MSKNRSKNRSKCRSKNRCKRRGKNRCKSEVVPGKSTMDRSGTLFPSILILIISLEKVLFGVSCTNSSVIDEIINDNSWGVFTVCFVLYTALVLFVPSYL